MLNMQKKQGKAIVSPALSETHFNGRKSSCLNLVRLIFVRRENETKKWGLDAWKAAVTAMQMLAREDSERSAYIRSQLEDAKKAFSKILEEDAEPL